MEAVKLNWELGHWELGLGEFRFGLRVPKSVIAGCDDVL
jgi:hypothetical protein